MHAIDIRKYEAGVDIGGSKGLVKLCPHCGKPGCQIGKVGVKGGEYVPKVAHHVEVGWKKKTFRAGPRKGQTLSVLTPTWGSVCGVPKKLTKEEKARAREERKVEKKAEKLREREEAKAAKKAERERLRALHVEARLARKHAGFPRAKRAKKVSR